VKFIKHFKGDAGCSSMGTGSLAPCFIEQSRKAIRSLASVTLGP
jgi:hypothetical protein